MRHEQKVMSVWIGTNEYETGYRVGQNGVTAIVYRQQNHNDHSVGWFDILNSNGVYIASLGERFVSQVVYGQEPTP